MTHNPRIVDRETLLAVAVKIMETNAPGAITLRIEIGMSPEKTNTKSGLIRSKAARIE